MSVKKKDYILWSSLRSLPPSFKELAVCYHLQKAHIAFCHPHVRCGDSFGISHHGRRLWYFSCGASYHTSGTTIVLVSSDLPTSGQSLAPSLSLPVLL